MVLSPARMNDHQKYCQYRRVRCDWCHDEMSINLLGVYFLLHKQCIAYSIQQHSIPVLCTDLYSSFLYWGKTSVAQARPRGLGTRLIEQVATMPA